MNEAVRLLVLAFLMGGFGEGETPSVADLHYVVTFDSVQAAERVIWVSLDFKVDGPGPVLLSMPAWTPGAYDIKDFAANVVAFSAEDERGDLDWDKTDHDTWRVSARGEGRVSVQYRYRAAELNCHTTWAGPDFALFNGTALFMIPDGPEGLEPSLSPRLSIRTEPGWVVVNGLGRTRGIGEYVTKDVHELLDMPTFIGEMDVDSMDVGGRWFHLATYPVGSFSGEARTAWWSEVEAMLPPMESLWGEVPFETYTTLIAFDEESPGGAALEHRNSHLGVYSPALSGPDLAWITSHEILHAWNVKRLRPAEMVPYDYSGLQPTTLLWVAEGLTEYYTHVALVRAGLLSPEEYYRRVFENIELVEGLPPVALEDASLSTWLSPVDGTGTIYYQKGALAGLLLDILIRDGTSNRRSLDDVVRTLYQTTYKQGRGFSNEGFWQVVSDVAGGRSFSEFMEKYVDGREPYPWAEVLPLAGLVLASDTARVPSLGASLGINSATGRIRLNSLVDDRPLAKAGAAVGDILLEAGGVPFSGLESVREFQNRFGETWEGDTLRVLVERGADTIPLEMEIQLVNRITRSFREDPGASPGAVAIREGILHGRRGASDRDRESRSGPGIRSDSEESAVVDFEGNSYRTVKIGAQWWMAENLRSRRDADGDEIESRVYEDDPSHEEPHGRLYTWNAAMAGSTEPGGQGICPEGWRIPSRDDWNSLFRFVGGDEVAGGALKAKGEDLWEAPNAGATDAFRFHGLAGGGFDGRLFEGLGVGGHYWSSTGEGNQAFAPTLHRDTPEITRLTLPRTFALSVRCVSTSVQEGSRALPPRGQGTDR